MRTRSRELNDAEKEGEPDREGKRLKTTTATTSNPPPHGLNVKQLLQCGWCTLEAGDELQAILRSYMVEAQSFFGLPRTSKFKCQQGQDGGVAQHGYTCVGDGAKEVLDVRRYVGPRWMDTASMMLPSAIECHKALDGLSRTVLGELNDGLKLPRAMGCHEGTSFLEEELLDSRDPFEGSWSSSVLTALHYAPPQSGASVGVAPGSSHVLAPAHIDRGMLTLIYSETEGLEVRRDGGEGAGPWVNVLNTSSSSTRSSGRQGQLTVLLGSTLEYATAGAVRAVEHRVVGAHTRHSIVYRLRARPTALLKPMAMAARLDMHLDMTLPGLSKPEGRRPLTVEQFMQTFDGRRTSINTDHGLPAASCGSGGGGGCGGGGGGEDDGGGEHEETKDGMPAASQQVQQQQQHTSRGAASDANQDVAGGPSASDTVIIRIKDGTGEETLFKVKRNVQFGKVFDAYARRKGVDGEKLRFLLNGTRLVPFQTPADVDWHEGDQIDTMLHELGD